MSRVAGALAEGVAWLERGADQAGAARRLRTLDRLTQIADQQLLAAGLQARRDLLDRQQALQLAAGEVLRDAILWLALGAIGVVHEVNNPLMAIAAHAENSIADSALPEPQRAEMLQILRQARRAAKLLRGLLRFVRVTEREVTRVNLNDVVRGAMDLVSYRFALDEIAVGGRLDPALVAALGDAIKLEQVIVNLLSNAIDALRAIKPPRELTVDTWCEEARVSVAVEDSARGVPADMVPRLFRPFATTKAR